MSIVGWSKVAALKNPKKGITPMSVAIVNFWLNRSLNVPAGIAIIMYTRSYASNMVPISNLLIPISFVIQPTKKAIPPRTMPKERVVDELNTSEHNLYVRDIEVNLVLLA